MRIKLMIVNTNDSTMPSTDSCQASRSSVLDAQLDRRVPLLPAVAAVFCSWCSAKAERSAWSTPVAKQNIANIRTRRTLQEKQVVEHSVLTLVLCSPWQNKKSNIVFACTSESLRTQNQKIRSHNRSTSKQPQDQKCQKFDQKYKSVALRKSFRRIIALDGSLHPCNHAANLCVAGWILCLDEASCYRIQRVPEEEEQRKKRGGKRGKNGGEEFDFENSMQKGKRRWRCLQAELFQVFPWEKLVFFFEGGLHAKASGWAKVSPSFTAQAQDVDADATDAVVTLGFRLCGTRPRFVHQGWMKFPDFTK